MSSVYISPSFYACILNGLLLLLALFLLYSNYSEVKSFDLYKIMMLILIFSLAIGIHGLMHLGLEVYYKYNPLQYVLNK